MTAIPSSVDAHAKIVSVKKKFMIIDVSIFFAVMHAQSFPFFIQFLHELLLLGSLNLR